MEIKMNRDGDTGTSNEETSNEETSNEETSNEETSNEETSNEETSNEETSNEPGLRAWRSVVPMEPLKDGPHVFREGPKQIVIFRLGDQVSAIDNRCPHEGYPLAVGSVDDEGILTCNWHNWKFRLKDGVCLLGGDHVRRYPTKVEAGVVSVDLSPPPREEVEAGILRGLRGAFDERDFGRICREITRLHFEGLEPEVSVIRAIEWSHDRLEYGTTHAYAAMADWLAETGHQSSWETRLIGLAEAVDHAAHDALRHPIHAYASAGRAYDELSLLAAIESQDSERAESLVGRALSDGTTWVGLRKPLARAALDHYNSFGHSAIYVQKTGDLIEHLGQQVEAPLIRALTRHLCFATREDLIPEFNGYRKTLEGLPAFGSIQQLDPPAPEGIKECLSWLESHVASHAPLALYQALLESLARSMLYHDARFEQSFDRPVSDNVGWLDFTHALTFANAVRVLAEIDPELWRPGLVQMVCFLGRNHKYLDLGQNMDRWHVEDAEAFTRDSMERFLDHSLRDPIFSAHLIKTFRAVLTEANRAEGTCRRTLLASLNRFLNAPLKQKHVRRLARQAISLVEKDFRS